MEYGPIFLFCHKNHESRLGSGEYELSIFIVELFF